MKLKHSYKDTNYNEIRKTCVLCPKYVALSYSLTQSGTVQIESEVSDE